MGNWRTVHIVGACAKEDVPKLAKALDYGDDLDGFHPLVSGGIFGVGDWAAENIDAVGNLGERGYGAQDVAEALWMLLQVAPSLRVKVHCGGDFESPRCTATVAVVGDQVGQHKVGKVLVMPPQVGELPDINSRRPLENRVADELVTAVRRAKAVAEKFSQPIESIEKKP